MRKKLGLTQTELARRIGFVRNYISLIENGREPSPRFIRALELIEQAPPPNIEHPSVTREEPPYFVSRRSKARRSDTNLAFDDSESAVPLRIIPLLTWAQAGTAQAWENLQEHEGLVGFNLRDPKAVAVQIRGDAMEPQYPQGTYAIVYPSYEAKSGDFVIARLNDGTVMFKRLHVDGNRCTFISLNPMYPPITVERARIEMLLPVGGTYQNQL